MNTWDKKVKVNKKMIPKRNVLAYYRKLWNESPIFRSLLRKNGSFIRATYDGKTIIKRRGVRFYNFNDLEEAVKEHAVEFHIPTNKTKYASYLDIDVPPKFQPNRKKIAISIVNKLKNKHVNVSLVTDAPSGAHVFSTTPKAKLMKALHEIEAEDKRLIVGKSSKTKIVMDPNEPNVSIPGSLSHKGKPYRMWKK